MEKVEMTCLVIEAQAGDADAMEKLLAEIYPSVSYQCRKVLQNTPGDVEDVIQEILLAVYMKIGSLEKPEAFRSWVNQITVRRCINMMNARPREYQFAEDEDGHSVEENLEELDRQKIPDAAIDNEETARMIQALIDRLPDSQRITVYFFYYDGLSVKQIAGLMQTTENTVKSRLNYARKAIKEGVLEYERRDGVKLYSLSPLPFLLFFLRRCAESEADPAAASAVVQSVVSYGAGNNSGRGRTPGAQNSREHSAGRKQPKARESIKKMPGKTGAKYAGKAVASRAAGGVAVKVAAGVLAAAVTVGGGTYLVTGGGSRSAPEPEVTQTFAAPEDRENGEEPAQIQSQPVQESEATQPAQATEAAPAEEPCTILRTEVDLSAYNPNGFNCEMYRETPVFSGDAKGYPKINAFFEEIRNAFLNRGGNGEALLIETHKDGSFSRDFRCEEICTVRSQTEQLVSVTIVTFYNGEQSTPLGYNGYTFDVQTGELLELTDLMGCTEEDVLSRVNAQYNAVYDSLPETGELKEVSKRPFAGFGSCGALTFYVENDQIWVKPTGQDWTSALPAIALPDEIRYGSDGQEGETPNYTLLRTDVDTSAYNTDSFTCEMYLETPEFSGDAKGYPKINEFFADMRDGFLSGEDENVAFMFERMDAGFTAGCSGFSYTNTCTVRCQTERFVSVSIGTSQYAGGAHPAYAVTGYTFDTQTGELLEMEDLVGGTEQDNLNRIIALYNGQGYNASNGSDLSWYGWEDFTFYVEDGQVWVTPKAINAYPGLPPVVWPDEIRYGSHD